MKEEEGISFSDELLLQHEEYIQELEEEWRDYKDEEANNKLRRKQEASAAASCSENAMRFFLKLFVISK